MSDSIPITLEAYLLNLKLKKPTPQYKSKIVSSFFYKENKSLAIASEI